MFDVIIYGDPLLRKVCLPVEHFDAELAHFVDEMIETMREKDGVGLAAPQVGNCIRLAVVDATVGENPAIVLINPVITYVSQELWEYEEGCLSIPDIRLKLKRPVQISVDAVDVKGKPFHIEKAEGLFGRALFHEIDHLNGVMFVDHASALQYQLINGKLKKLARSHRVASKKA